MKKLLKPADVLSLILAGVVDVYQELKDPMGLFSDYWENIYGFVPSRYKKSNLRQMVWRGIRTGNIEKVIKDGEAYLRLTSQGKEKVKRDFPFFSFQNKKWDSFWRVVIFDIEEVDRSIRDKLRLKLKELGFGMFQKSVWITPHDIIADFQEFIERLSLKDKVYIMEVSEIVVGDQQQLAEQIWNLQEINKQYKKLIDKLFKFKNKGKNSSVKNRDRDKSTNYKKEDLQREYLELLIKDPFLPEQLLPDDWLREKVTREIKELLKNK